MTAPIKTIHIVRQGPAGPAGSPGLISAWAGLTQPTISVDEARTALGLPAQAQPFASVLSAIAALGLSAGDMIYATGAADFDIAPSQSFGRSLLAAANAGAARTLLGAGGANGLATLGADGLIPVAQLPALAITDTFEVASQATMLALGAQKGDIAIRSDESKSYVLSGSDPSLAANWKLLRTPTDAVLSVAGLTGAVSASNLKSALSLGQSDISGLTTADTPIFAEMRTNDVNTGLRMTTYLGFYLNGNRRGYISHSGPLDLVNEVAGNNIRLTPGAGGHVQFGTYSAIGGETVAGYITIRDSSGTVRKLAVMS